jgi:uncharacterized protein
MIGTYPELGELELTDRHVLDPLFRRFDEGVSELSFAGIYCFRGTHGYRVTRMADGTIVLTGDDKGSCFFVCPFGLPRPDQLGLLFDRCLCLKLATAAQASHLGAEGYAISEDRDNFDYLYRRQQLATLAGRALQKKRNLVNAFEKRYAYATEPLTPERIADAVTVLEAWREAAPDLADYTPARTALEHAFAFGLEGRITYVEGAPAGYAMGERAANGTMLVVHYEKTIPRTKGLYQYINMDFARAMTAEVTVINREQDLGDPGLRQAKLTYRPFDFLRKFRVRRAG